MQSPQARWRLTSHALYNKIPYTKYNLKGKNTHNFGQTSEIQATVTYVSSFIGKHLEDFFTNCVVCMHLRGQFFPGKLEIKNTCKFYFLVLQLLLEISLTTESAKSIRVKEILVAIVDLRK